MPLPIAAAIGLGAAGIGADIFSSISGRKDARRQFDANMDQFIQRRVADAKKAGIHPIFAMGAPAGAPTTLSASAPQVDYSAMADAVGGLANLKQTRAVAQKKMDVLDAEIRQRNAAADRDEAAAQVALSGIRTTSNRDNETEALVFGDVQRVPVEVPSRQKYRKDRQAGVQPFWMEVDFAPGLRLEVPRTDEMSELTQDVTTMLTIYARNKSKINKFAYDYAAGRYGEAVLSAQEIIKRSRKGDFSWLDEL